MSPDSSADGPRTDGGGSSGERAEQQVPGGRSLTEGVAAELREYPWNEGAGHALAAALGVVLGVVGLLAVGGFGSGPLLGQLQLVVIVAFAAHNVRFLLAEPGEMWFLGGQVARNPIEVIRLQSRQSGVPPDVPLDLYYLVPVVVLLLVGVAFALRDAGDEPRSPLRSVEYGLTVAVPYAVLMTVLVPALGRGTNFGNVKGPALASSALFGLAYPAVLVTAGAALALGVRLATAGE